MFRRVLAVVVALVGLWTDKGIAAGWAPTRAQRAQLELDKIVFTDAECRQIYAPYLEPNMPPASSPDMVERDHAPT